MLCFAPRFISSNGGKITIDGKSGQWQRSYFVIVMANTAGQWHALMGSYGRHRRPQWHAQIVCYGQHRRPYWHALIACYGQHRTPVAHSNYVSLRGMADTAGQWHTLISLLWPTPQASRSCRWKATRARKPLKQAPSKRPVWHALIV